MNKIFLIIISLFLVLPSYGKSPYGFTNNVEDSDISEGPLHKIIKNKEISYYIKIDKLNKRELTKEQYVDFKVNSAILPDKITYSFNIWFESIKQEIESSGRSEEFKDILPVLSTPIKLKQEKNQNKADITFMFTTPEKVDKLCHNALACYDLQKIHFEGGPTYTFRYIIAPISDLKSAQPLENLLIHEIGHYFGLADQYDYGLSSNKYNNDRIKSQVSVMDNSLNPPSCDDADGLINLIDYTLAKINAGAYSERAQKGWVSFCSDDSYYQNAKPYISNYCWVNYNEKGEQTGKICPEPFLFKNRDLAVDDNGLITRMVDRQNKWLFTYKYNASQPLISINVKSSDGKRPDMKINILSDEKTFRIPLNGKIYTFNIPQENSCQYNNTDRLKVFYKIYRDNWNKIPKGYPYSDKTEQSTSDIKTFPASYFNQKYLSKDYVSESMRICDYLPIVKRSVNKQ